jgi:hypothetical protein
VNTMGVVAKPYPFLDLSWFLGFTIKGNKTVMFGKQVDEARPDLEPFASKEERDSVLQTIKVLRNRDDLPSGAEGRPARLENLKKIDSLEQEYEDRLELRTLAVCPFCNTPYQHSLDPFGYDGSWWDSKHSGKEVACEHYRVIRIATNLHGHRANTWNGFDVNFGPEVPYVIPRLLELPNMVCTVSAIQLKCGYTLYPLVYFSKELIQHEQLTAQWAGEFFNSYETRRENWDFELEPWVRSGHLRWCQENNGELILQERKTEDFPLFNLPGHRGEQSAQCGELHQGNAPTQSSSHYDGSKA